MVNEDWLILESNNKAPPMYARPLLPPHLAALDQAISESMNHSIIMQLVVRTHPFYDTSAFSDIDIPY